MKGVIQQMRDGLGVGFSITTSETFLYLIIPLNPYQSTEGLWAGKLVDFDVEKFWETGIEKPFDVAIISDNKEKKKKNGKGNTKI